MPPQIAEMDEANRGEEGAEDQRGATLWTIMIQEFGVHSLIDVGCGRGTSTRWFYEHNVDVLCVEGSHAAVQQS